VGTIAGGVVIDRKKTVKKLDKVFSEYIRARDKYKCFTCGIVGAVKDGLMHAGHLFSRVNYSTRWDELNTHCTCKNCNYTHEYNPHIYVKAFIQKYGFSAYELLDIKHNKSYKISTPELLVLIDYYKNKIKEIENV
jgi:predicted nucleic-acid-binding Zn-ribbon protein